MPVPELPTSRTSAASCRSPPSTVSVPTRCADPASAASAIRAPSASTIARVCATSSPALSPSMVLVPRASRARIRARCDTDLSPGTRSVPRRTRPPSTDAVPRLVTVPFCRTAAAPARPGRCPMIKEFCTDAGAVIGAGFLDHAAPRLTGGGSAEPYARAMPDLADLEARAADHLEHSAYDFFRGGADEEWTLAANRRGVGRVAAPAARAARRVGGVDGDDRARRGRRDAGAGRADGLPRARLAAGGVGDGGRDGVGGLAHDAVDVLDADPGAGRRGGAGAPRWFQMYVYRERAVSVDLARRAAAAGYTRDRPHRRRAGARPPAARRAQRLRAAAAAGPGAHARRHPARRARRRRRRVEARRPRCS